MKTISILGSTGSIGRQALDLCRRHPDRYRVTALTARASKELLFEQVREFRPQMAGLTEGIRASEIPARRAKRIWCWSALWGLPGFPA